MKLHHVSMGVVVGVLGVVGMSGAGCSSATCEEVVDKIVRCEAESGDAAGGSDAASREQMITDCNELPPLAHDAVADCVLSASCEELNRGDDPLDSCVPQ